VFDWVNAQRLFNVYAMYYVFFRIYVFSCVNNMFVECCLFTVTCSMFRPVLPSFPDL
jgi:hypothetical protein